LQVGNGGTLGNITANTTDNSALVFDRSDSIAYAGNIAGPGSVSQIGSGVLSLSGSNSYTGGTSANTGTLILGGTNAIPVNTPLNIGATALVQLPPSTGPFTLSALNIATGGKIDLATNKLVLNYGVTDPIANIAANIASGYNAGAWSGPGITSTAAAAGGGKFSLGYLDGNTPSDTGAGNVAPNQILIAYTLTGDAFLEGSVGFDDLVVVAQNFGKTGEDWAGGNFNYDPTGSVGFPDLVSVAQNFGFTSPINNSFPATGLSPAWQVAQATSVIPEPGALMMIAAGAPGLLGRRRRR
jgi:autotransporter-associated beta strand protein